MKIHRMTDIHKLTNIKNDIHLHFRAHNDSKPQKKQISLNKHSSEYKNHKEKYTQNQTQTMRPKTLNTNIYNDTLLYLNILCLFI